jgi:hypothetical protein
MQARLGLIVLRPAAKFLFRQSCHLSFNLEPHFLSRCLSSSLSLPRSLAWRAGRRNKFLETIHIQGKILQRADLLCCTTESTEMLDIVEFVTLNIPVPEEKVDRRVCRSGLLNEKQNRHMKRKK